MQALGAAEESPENANRREGGNGGDPHVHGSQLSGGSHGAEAALGKSKGRPIHNSAEKLPQQQALRLRKTAFLDHGLPWLTAAWTCMTQNRLAMPAAPRRYRHRCKAIRRSRSRSKCKEACHRRPQKQRGALQSATYPPCLENPNKPRGAAGSAC